MARSWVLVCIATSMTIDGDARRVGFELEEAVRRHGRLAYRVAYSVLGGAAEAEDAVQETFLKLVRYRSRLERVEDPAAFIARVAWRVALDHRQRGRNRAEVSLGGVGEALRTMRAKGDTAEELAASREMQRLLARLVDTLPSKLRDVVRLSTQAEMSASEVAAVLGIPESSVRTRLFRARGLLREKVAALFPAPGKRPDDTRGETT